MARRVPFLVFSAAAVCAQLWAVSEASWFRVDDDFVDVGIKLGRIDAPDIHVGTIWYTIFVGIVVLATTYFALRTAASMLGVVAGSSVVDRLQWPSARAVYLQGGVVFALATTATFVMPGLYLGSPAIQVLGAMNGELQMSLDDAIPIALTRDSGGFLLMFSILMTGGLALIASRTRWLATSLGWADDDDEAVAIASPEAPRERPMIKSPLPAAPMIDHDPFRSPVRPIVQVVTTAAPVKPAPRVDGGDDAPKPKFLG